MEIPIRVDIWGVFFFKAPLTSHIETLKKRNVMLNGGAADTGEVQLTDTEKLRSKEGTCIFQYRGLKWFFLFFPFSIYWWCLFYVE